VLPKNLPATASICRGRFLRHIVRVPTTGPLFRVDHAAPVSASPPLLQRPDLQLFQRFSFSFFYSFLRISQQAICGFFFPAFTSFPCSISPLPPRRRGPPPPPFFAAKPTFLAQRIASLLFPFLPPPFSPPPLAREECGHDPFARFPFEPAHRLTQTSRLLSTSISLPL